MANHGVDIGIKSQQQIAKIAGLLGAIAGALLFYDTQENVLVGLGVGAALSFVVALLNRWVGILICVISCLMIVGYFTGA